jgi:hypothetical protein
MPSTTQPDVVTLQKQLDEARAAYHNLLTGQAARVIVDQNGERVEFTTANRQSLYAYIQSLIAQINAANSGITPPTGPLGFMF